MNDVDCVWLRAMVVEALQMLAAPHTTQIEYVHNGEFSHDELALELDDVLEAFLTQCQPTKSATLALNALDHQLDKMSGQHNARLWTDMAVKDAEEWMTVRRFATRSLIDLHETPSSPTDLWARTRRHLTWASRDGAAVYGLVLRHMIEIGHGGASSGRQSFYVLNRAIDDVENPSFNPHAFEDEETGLPFGNELMKSLTDSVKDVADIEFVSKLLDLIDLESKGPVHVKGSQGFVALGPIRESARNVVVGAYFHAGSCGHAPTDMSWLSAMAVGESRSSRTS